MKRLFVIKAVSFTSFSSSSCKKMFLECSPCKQICHQAVHGKHLSCMVIRNCQPWISNFSSNRGILCFFLSACQWRGRTIFYFFLIYGSAISNSITLSEVSIIRLLCPYFEVIVNLGYIKEITQFVWLMTSDNAQIYVQVPAML